MKSAALYVSTTYGPNEVPFQIIRYEFGIKGNIETVWYERTLGGKISKKVYVYEDGLPREEHTFDLAGDLREVVRNEFNEVGLLTKLIQMSGDGTVLKVEKFVYEIDER